jgi:hypothetical protein
VGLKENLSLPQQAVQCFGWNGGFRGDAGWLRIEKCLWVKPSWSKVGACHDDIDRVTVCEDSAFLNQGILVRYLTLLTMTVSALLAQKGWCQDVAYQISDQPEPQVIATTPANLADETSDTVIPICNQPCDSNIDGWTGEFLKGIPLGRQGWLDVGASYRARYQGETNIRPYNTGGLSGVDDSFWLHQTRLWFTGSLTERLDFRVGFIDAATAGQDFAPRPREVNRTDLYQAYVDALLKDGPSTILARIGRQEIRYGSARLMMAPAWANRRRSHDGVRFICENEDWEINPFWVRPAIRNRESFRTFDNTNPGQQLYGIFSTYRGLENEDEVDLYWLAFDITSPLVGARYDTLGSRYIGENEDWLYEIEGGVQLGTNPNDTAHLAGFVTGGLGRRLSRLPWSPELWCYYDWASGSDTVGNGFNHYVPRAHYYLGFMDLYGRRNIEDLNLRLKLKPKEKLTLLAWCHFFSLANGNDVPYNLNMTPFAQLPAGSAGSQTLGTELDLVATYDVTEKAQFRVGYSYFWSGTFYSTTPGVPYDGDANFLYSHIVYEF